MVIFMRGETLRLADKTLGLLLYRLARIKKPRKQRRNGKIKKILVIKLWAIGDTICAMPAVKLLKERYQNAEVHILCTKWNKPILERYDIFDKIWIFELSVSSAVKAVKAVRKENFDLAVDFEPYTKTSAAVAYYSGAPMRIGFENRKELYTHSVKINEKQHVVFTFADLLKPLFQAEAPKMLVPPQPSKGAQLWAAKFTRNKKIVCIHPGSAATAENRRWSAERFAGLAKRLDGFDVVIVGSKGESGLAEKIAAESGAVNLAGKINFDELIALCYKSRLFLANDSGPMHVAAACNCPTIGLFGPNVPERYGPFCKKCIGLRKAKGPPCILPFRAEFDCGHDHMKNITVDDVFTAAKNLLKK